MIGTKILMNLILMISIVDLRKTWKREWRSRPKAVKMSLILSRSIYNSLTSEKKAHSLRINFTNRLRELVSTINYLPYVSPLTLPTSPFFVQSINFLNLTLLFVYDACRILTRFTRSMTQTKLIKSILMSSSTTSTFKKTSSILRNRVPQKKSNSKIRMLSVA